MKTLLLLILLAVPLPLFSQDKCDHTSGRKERFDNMRVLPPISITFYDGRRVEYIFEDKHVIVAGSLEIDADTVKPADFSKTYKKGKWWAMYCLKDFHLYVIAEVLPGQIKNK
jgi:hypothetical protein